MNEEIDPDKSIEQLERSFQELIIQSVREGLLPPETESLAQEQNTVQAQTENFTQNPFQVQYQITNQDNINNMPLQQGQLGIPPPTEIIYDPCKYIDKMDTYNGHSTAELVRFLERISVIEDSITNYSVNAKKFITTQLRQKLVGSANEALFKYSDTAKDITTLRKILTDNFGEKETYLQIKERGERLRFNGIENTYRELQHVLTRMNNKYHLSAVKDIDRSPENNEKCILNIFTEKIPANAASIIIARDIKTLAEAYRVLEENNWLRNDRYYDKQNYKPNQYQHYTVVPRRH